MVFKRAQISIFTIIAVIIILVSITAVAFLNFGKSESIEAGVVEIESNIELRKQYGDLIETHVDNCLKSVTEAGLERVFLSGGLYTGGTSIAPPEIVLIKDGSSVNPIDINELKENLKFYIEDTTGICINQIEVVENVFVNLSSDKEFEFDTSFPDSFAVDLHYPIVIFDNKIKVEVSDFSYVMRDIPFSRIDLDVNGFIGNDFPSPFNETEIQDHISDFLSQGNRASYLTITYQKLTPQLYFFTFKFSENDRDVQVLFAVKE